MELRRVGEGEPRPKTFSVFLVCQNRRGEVALSSGELWNGEESVSRPIFLGGEFQLGEFRRFSDGEISERGRGEALDMFAVEAKLFLANRRGCTESAKAINLQPLTSSSESAVASV